MASTTARRIARRLEILGELVRFLRERKLWWLLPMLAVLLVFALLLLFAQGSPVAPLVYPLF